MNIAWSDGMDSGLATLNILDMLRFTRKRECDICCVQLKEIEGRAYMYMPHGFSLFCHTGLFCARVRGKPYSFLNTDFRRVLSVILI